MKIYADHPNAERILQEGWELFQQKGYRGVSVDELCQRCQITKCAVKPPAFINIASQRDAMRHGE
jgi:hypothetical protein